MRKGRRRELSFLAGWLEEAVSRYRARLGEYPAYQRADRVPRTASATPAFEPIVGDGYSIEEDADENRLVIRFDEKPATEMLAKLRAGGFKWSPTRSAHVRMRSNGATYAAKHIFGLA